MSSIQRRAKNVYQIPLIHLIEQKTQSTTTVMDPRSPSANVTRYKINLFFFLFNK
jgi:hypothetical protein